MGQSPKLQQRVFYIIIAAALCIARHFGIDDYNVKNSLLEFRALPHRLELIEQINGVSWYNDSKATTPAGAITALEAFDQPVIIVAGGYDKKIPFDEFGEKIVQKAKAAILIGQTAPKIAETIEKAKLNTRSTQYAIRDTSIKIVNSLSDAVTFAHSLAQFGDIVLLSPACASYDMFDNFEHRGNEFIKLVKSLNK